MRWHGACNFTLTGERPPALARAPPQPLPLAAAHRWLAQTKAAGTPQLGVRVAAEAAEGGSRAAARAAAGGRGGGAVPEAEAEAAAEEAAALALLSRALRRLGEEGEGAAAACTARAVRALPLRLSARKAAACAAEEACEEAHGHGFAPWLALEWARGVLGGRGGDSRAPSYVDAGAGGAERGACAVCAAAPAAAARVGGCASAVALAAHEAERLAFTAIARGEQARGLGALRAAAALHGAGCGADPAASTTAAAAALRNVAMLSAAQGDADGPAGAVAALRAQFALDADAYRAWTNMWPAYDAPLAAEARFFGALQCGSSSGTGADSYSKPAGGSEPAAAGRLCALRAVVRALRADERSPVVIAHRFVDSARLLRASGAGGGAAAATGSAESSATADAAAAAADAGEGTGPKAAGVLLRHDHAYGSTTFLEWRKLVTEARRWLSARPHTAPHERQQHLVLGSSLGWFVFFSALSLGVRAHGVEVLPSAVAHARRVAAAHGGAGAAALASFELGSAADARSTALAAEMRAATMVTVASKAWPRALRRGVYALLARYGRVGALVLDYHDELATGEWRCAEAGRGPRVRFRRLGRALLRTGCGELEGCPVYAFEALPCTH
eukprot:g65.t1